jgi:MoaA/NifB/PqqE/SkfB family radical SAM enzyme
MCGNLGEVTIEDAWNSPKYRQLRSSIIDGSFSMCRKDCFVPRCNMDKVMPTDIKKIFDAGIAELPLSSIKNLTLGFDQRCNLRCRTCRNAPFVPTKEQLHSYDMIMQELDKLAPNIEILDVNGGEPLASPIMVDYLRSIDLKKYKSLHSIYIATNGILLDEQMWDSMSGVHDLFQSIKVSMDAFTEETYLINRRGGNFRKLMSNLWFLSDQAKRRNKSMVTLNFIVMKSNFRELPDFCRMAESMGFNVFLQQLENWGTFTEDEFRIEAVHERTNPYNQEFIEMIGALKTQYENMVNVGTLTM